MTSRLLLIVLLMLSSARALAATAVIPLNYRMAEEMLPIAQATLGNGGKVNAYGNQLIVNASPAKIEELRQLLEQLDSPPRRLLISVASSEEAFNERRGYAVDGSASVGGVEIHSGRGEVRGSDRVRIIDRSTDRHGGGSQQIQATEGYPALIQVGQSVPLESGHIAPYGQVYRHTEYRDVTQGYYVTARVSGDIVHVTLSSRHDRLAPSPGVIDTQSLDTHVTGRLGEWISIGGASGSRESEERGLLRRDYGSSQEELSLRLKVETLD